MSDPDPFWSILQSVQLRISPPWLSPDGTLTFLPDAAIGIGDRSALLFQSIDNTELHDILRVDLVAGNLYYFWVSAGTRPIIEIFDGQAFRLLSTDGDDIGIPDIPGEDSILFFAPEVSGRYHLRISFADPSRIGSYTVEAWEDIGGNFVNDLEPVVGEVSIEATDAVKAEGATGTTTFFTFTVRRTGDLSADQQVLWFAAPSGTNPAAADDFKNPETLADWVSFAPGESAKTITIAVAGDNLPEPDETFEVWLAFPSSGLAVGQGFAEGRILADEQAFTFSPADLSVAEGDSGTTRITYTLTRVDSRSGFSNTWTLQGHGANPVDAADFAGGVLPSGWVSFGEGQSAAEISFEIKGDTLAEFDEGFLLRFADPSPEFGTPSVVYTATGTVRDDDSRVGITLLSSASAEGTGGESVHVFTVQREAPTGTTHSVVWQASSALTGTSASAADFVGGAFPSGMLTFGPGEATRTIEIRIAGDSLAEGPEGFVVRLLSSSPGLRLESDVASSIIADDDTGIRIARLSAPDHEGTGGESVHVFSVQRAAPAGTTHSVRWQVEAATGSPSANGADFVGGVMPSGTLTFGPGETSRTIEIRIAGDTLPEQAESFVVRLLDPSPGIPLQAATATSVIANDDGTAPTVLALQDEVFEGSGGTNILRFQLARSTDAGTQVMDWTIRGAGSDPVDGSDFVGGELPSGQVTFLPGESIKLVTVRLATDSAREFDERLEFRVTSPSGVEPGAATSVTTLIRNDDAEVAFSNGGLSIPEGHAGVTAVPVRLVRDGYLDRALDIPWAVAPWFFLGRQVDAADFPGGVLPSGIAHFAVGEAEARFVIPVQGDTASEPDETFNIDLTPVPGASIPWRRAEVFILNDEPRLERVTKLTASEEGNAGNTPFAYEVRRVGDLSAEASVDWKVTPSSFLPTSANDFVGGPHPSGRVTFAPGQATAVIEFEVVGDSAIEPDENFTLSLRDPSPGLQLGPLSSSIADRIINDDAEVSIAADAAIHTEGDAGWRSASFTVTRRGDTDTAHSLAWAVEPSGTAGADANDFLGRVLPAGSLAFAPGETTRTITVHLRGDTLFEPNEGFLLRLSAPSEGLSIVQATARATIQNDDTSVFVAIAVPVRNEGNGADTGFTFQIHRRGFVDQAHGVDWAVGPTGENRSNLADFPGSVFPTGRVEFAPGETVKAVTVPVRADRIIEGDESFLLRLLNPSPGLTIGQATAVATIRNDDALVTAIADTPALAEGTGGTTPFTFTLTRSGDLAVTHALTWTALASGPVKAATNDFAGGVLATGRISFAPGETVQQVVVAVEADSRIEADETFLLRLSAPSAGLSLSFAQAVATILDDDAPRPSAPDWVL